MTTELTSGIEAGPVHRQASVASTACHDDESRSSRSGRRQLEWAIPVALVVIMLAQLWGSVVQLSITSDEIDHLHAAYRYWQCNDFGWNPEHPPLVKIVAGLPLQAMRINDPIPQACGAQNSKVIDFLAGHQFIFANPERMLTAARFAVSLFPVLLLLTVWFFARKMFGLPVAIIAGVLIAFDPNILANGALVTTDIAAALGFLLALYALYCYVTEPTFNRVIPLGLALGFAFCAKFSTIVLIVILPMVLLADISLFAPDQRRQKLVCYGCALAAVAAIAIMTLWACYGFRYTGRPGGVAIWSPPRLVMSHGTVTTKIIPELKTRRVLPEAYLVGLQDVLVESEVGRPSFLLGKLYRTGNWFYFPIAASIKFTLPLLLMVAVSAGSFRFWRSHRRELLFLLLPVIMFLAFCMRSGLNIGIRHLLPILPLLTIFGAAAAWEMARSRHWAKIVLVGLLVFQSVSSLRAFPNYLCYSNEAWGGPSETYRYLSYSDVDWGQAQKMVRDYVDKNHPSNCFFIRSYNNLNSDYGIPCGGISEIQWDQIQTPFTGTLIAGISEVNGAGYRSSTAEVYRALKNVKPTAKLGGSAVLIYQGTYDLGPIVAVQLLVRARRLGEEEQSAVLELAQQAAKLDPLSADAHVVMCGSYHALGQFADAERECNRGLELVRKDPLYGPEQLTYLEQFITNKGLRIYSSQ